MVSVCRGLHDIGPRRRDRSDWLTDLHLPPQAERRVGHQAWRIDAKEREQAQEREDRQEARGAPGARAGAGY